MAHHQHVEMLVEGVDGVRPGRIGGGGQHIGVGGDGDDVGCVAATRAFGVVGVDAASGNRPERGLHEPGLVEGVRVQGHLNTGLVGHSQAGIDGGRGRAPVLVQFETRSTGADLLVHSRGADGVAFAEQRDVHRPVVGRGQDRRQMPGAGGDGGGLAALGRSGAAADQCGDPVAERLVHDLWADEVHMAVDGSGGDDLAVAGDHLGRRSDDQLRMHPRHRVGIACLAQCDDPSVPDTQVGLDDSPVVEHHHAGDDGVGGAVGARGAALPHGLADHLAATEHRFLTGQSRATGAVLGDLDQQVGVGEPDPVAGGGPEQLRVPVASEKCHVRSPRGYRGRWRRACRWRRARCRTPRGCRRAGPASPSSRCPVRIAPRCRRECRACGHRRRSGRS